MAGEALHGEVMGYGDEPADELDFVPLPGVLQLQHRQEERARVPSAAAVLEAEREQRAVALRVAGKSLAAIGRDLGLNESAVSRLLRRALHRPAPEMGRSAILLECARLDALVAEAMPLTAATQTFGEKGEVVTVRNAPDIRLAAMAVVERLIGRRMKLLGLDRLPPPTPVTKTDRARAVLAPMIAGATTDELESIRATYATIASRTRSPLPARTVELLGGANGAEGKEGSDTSLERDAATVSKYKQKFLDQVRAERRQAEKGQEGGAGGEAHSGSDRPGGGDQSNGRS